MAGKPVVLPDAYTGEGSWDEWLEHFENVAAVSKWTPEQKLLWLKVRLTGRAQRAFKQLPEEAQAAYPEAVKALHVRFDPESKWVLYVAEFYTRTKKKSEGWADFGEDLRVLADRAFPTLGADARQLLALQQYLMQLDNPQVAFAVKQRHPTTVEAAVSITLELESYLLPKQRVARVEEAPVDPLGIKQDALLETMSTILDRLECLETQTSVTPRNNQPKAKEASATRCLLQVRQRGTLCSRMSSQKEVAGKRQTLGVVEPTSEGEPEAPKQCPPPTTVYSTVSELSYFVSTTINDGAVSFLIDTGSAFTILRKDTFERICPDGPPLDASSQTFVGVNGNSLDSHGSYELCINISGRLFNHRIFVLSDITTEALLGLDFLEAHGSTLALGAGELHFSRIGGKVPLCKGGQPDMVRPTAVLRVTATTRVPALSKMEVLATLEGPAPDGMWLVEGCKTSSPPVLVARAVVTAQAHAAERPYPHPQPGKRGCDPARGQ